MFGWRGAVMHIVPMRVVTLLKLAEERRASTSPHAHVCALVPLLCATVLAGCASEIGKTRVADSRSRASASIPLPTRAQLHPQPEPDCDFKATPGTDERQKLDYERQCYRQAEGIVRNRLQRLQDSVEQTVKAVQARD
jgi:hypothetical protein